MARKKLQAAASTLVPRLLTVNQSAAYLNCAVWAVRKLNWDGLVRGVQVGRRLLFDKNDLDKYVDALKRAS